jgi:hypothetical protein
MQSRQCCRPSACPRLLLPAALQPCEPRNGRCGAERKKTSGQTAVHQVTDLLAGANVEVARRPRRSGRRGARSSRQGHARHGDEEQDAAVGWARRPCRMNLIAAYAPPCPRPRTAACSVLDVVNIGIRDEAALRRMATGGGGGTGRYRGCADITALSALLLLTGGPILANMPHLYARR